MNYRATSAFATGLMLAVALIGGVALRPMAATGPLTVSAAGALVTPRIVRHDARLDALVPADARLEKIAEGFEWVEGPLWDPATRSLLFSDIPANSVFRWKEGQGVTLFLKPSGYTGAAPFTGREPGSNGLAFDPQGRLVLAEHGDRRIARLEKDGRKTTLVDRFEGPEGSGRLNSPNDLVFDSQGNLFFTDPPFGLPKAFDDPAKELDFQGVYRLSRDGKLTLLTREFLAPNGIALSPDEKTLYITDVHPSRAAWYAYDLRADGSVANGRVLLDAAPWKQPPYFGPDGLKVDRAGNLFAARPGGINVIAPDGALLGAIETGAPTSNLAWGDDGATLYITAGTAIYRLRVSTRGAGF